MNSSLKELLILEDDRGLREVLAADFKDKGYSVTEASQLSQIPARSFNFAIVDLRLNGESGLAAISLLIKQLTECKIVVLTGFGSIATAVEAVKLGAINYLTKPANIEQIEEAFNSHIPKENNLKNEEHIDLSKRISLSQNEHEYINYVLNVNEGNISKTARELGLHRQSLQRKLRKKP
ncbi:MAG: response regulator [Bacteriovoracaceae bacterium]|nr:response regulator [Bacteriovoracaceae bacterium]